MTSSTRRRLEAILGRGMLNVTLSRKTDPARKIFLSNLSKDQKVHDALSETINVIGNVCPYADNPFKKDPQLGDFKYVLDNWGQAAGEHKGAVANFFLTLTGSPEFKKLGSASVIARVLQSRFQATSKATFHEPMPRFGGESYPGQSVPSASGIRHEREKQGSAVIVSNLSGAEGKGDQKAGANPDAFRENQALPKVVSIQDAMTDISSYKPSPVSDELTIEKSVPATQSSREMKYKPTQQVDVKRAPSFLGKRKFVEGKYVDSKGVPIYLTPPTKKISLNKKVHETALHFNKQVTDEGTSGQVKQTTVTSPTTNYSGVNPTTFQTSGQGLGNLSTVGGQGGINPSTTNPGVNKVPEAVWKTSTPEPTSAPEKPGLSLREAGRGFINYFWPKGDEAESRRDNRELLEVSEQKLSHSRGLKSVSNGDGEIVSYLRDLLTDNAKDTSVLDKLDPKYAEQFIIDNPEKMSWFGNMIRHITPAYALEALGLSVDPTLASVVNIVGYEATKFMAKKSFDYFYRKSSEQKIDQEHYDHIFLKSFVAPLEDILAKPESSNTIIIEPDFLVFGKHQFISDSNYQIFNKIIEDYRSSSYPIGYGNPPRALLNDNYVNILSWSLNNLYNAQIGYDRMAISGSPTSKELYQSNLLMAVVMFMNVYGAGVTNNKILLNFLSPEGTRPVRYNYKNLDSRLYTALTSESRDTLYSAIQKLSEGTTLEDPGSGKKTFLNNLNKITETAQKNSNVNNFIALSTDQANKFDLEMKRSRLSNLFRALTERPRDFKTIIEQIEHLKTDPVFDDLPESRTDIQTMIKKLLISKVSSISGIRDDIVSYGPIRNLAKKFYTFDRFPSMDEVENLLNLKIPEDPRLGTALTEYIKYYEPKKKQFPVMRIEPFGTDIWLEITNYVMAHQGTQAPLGAGAEPPTEPPPTDAPYLLDQTKSQAPLPTDKTKAPIMEGTKIPVRQGREETNMPKPIPKETTRSAPTEGPQVEPEIRIERIPERQHNFPMSEKSKTVPRLKTDAPVAGVTYSPYEQFIPHPDDEPEPTKKETAMPGMVAPVQSPTPTPAPSSQSIAPAGDTNMSLVPIAPPTQQPGGVDSTDIPLLRPSFPAGGANIVKKVNENKQILEIDSMQWEMFKDYYWEPNMEKDNALQWMNYIDQARRFYPPLDKAELLPQQASDAVDEQYARDCKNCYNIPPEFKRDGQVIIMSQIPEPNEPTSSTGTEQLFHDVYRETDYRTPADSFWNKMTAIEGTQIPDSMLENSNRLAGWDWPLLAMQNRPIVTTLY